MNLSHSIPGLARMEKADNLIVAKTLKHSITERQDTHRYFVESKSPVETTRTTIMLLRIILILILLLCCPGINCQSMSR